ncbi:MAG: hypothetical protein O3C44_06130 [Proteobacteria bacterium]|nr:hypothetical protein [Pseudomonadota bacterium]
MIRKLILFLLCAFEIVLILFMMAWPASSDESQLKYEIASPPNCKNNLGEKVLFKDVNNGRAKSAAGMAKRDDTGTPIVYRFAYQNSPKPLQQFIDFHECAHHQTGDVDLPHPPRNSPEHMMNESIADCIATLRIRDEINRGEDVVFLAVEQLVQVMITIGFPAMTTESRKANILTCLQKNETVDAFIDGVLKHRKLK